jgi:dTDP-4-dehydrorhamnose 3,5-epimerase
MDLLETPIEGVYIARTKRLSDERGQFARLFCMDDLATAHTGRVIRQINHSVNSTIGTVRGLHYQNHPHAEAKWVRCLKGKIWDVAVDLRRGSATFLYWYAAELSAENDLSLLVPEGCAHGFQVLEANSEVLYLHTHSYTPASEGGVRFDDAALSISWPLPVSNVSDRDRNLPLIDDQFKGLAL